MIWFLILLCLGLTITLVKTRHDITVERRIQTATLDSLLAVVGDEKHSLESSRQYFTYLRQNLSDEDFTTVIRNIATATDLDIILNDDGSLSEHAIDQLVPVFNNYINGVHRRMME